MKPFRVCFMIPLYKDSRYDFNLPRHRSTSGEMIYGRIKINHKGLIYTSKETDKIAFVLFLNYLGIDENRMPIVEIKTKGKPTEVKLFWSYKLIICYEDNHVERRDFTEWKEIEV